MFPAWLRKHAAVFRSAGICMSWRLRIAMRPIVVASNGRCAAVVIPERCRNVSCYYY
jgi:hypothetical protein